MAYEKQFWEQPHHDSSEEERLERDLKKIRTQRNQLLKLLEHAVEWIEEMHGETHDSKIYKQTITEFKNLK